MSASPLKKPRSAAVPGPEDREDSFQPLLERYHSLHQKFLESQQVFQSLKAQFDKISIASRQAVIESPQDIRRSSRNLQGELQKGGEASTQLADCVHELTKELEETNQKLSQEMSARAGAEETIRRRTEELLRSNEDLERFAYMASHDLKEPLRTVSAFTKLLAKRYRGRLDDDADDFMQYMLDGIQRMEQLITDVLVYCRVGSGEITRRRTDLNEVVDRAVENLKEAIQESKAQVGHARLPIVLGNESELLQIFQNLLGNAIKFHGPEAPVVTVSAERRDSEWVLAVEDNGIGIEPRYAGKIFELFTRLNTIADYPGSGIGLATCKKAVEHHGGRIFLKPKSNSGATFYFTLPCP
jgi:light-regulated signal transduction histidine kinase (bacteriophytochrome)